MLFLGAGVSKNAQNAAGERPKDWKEFIGHLADALPAPDQKEVKDAMAEGDLLTACELARRALRPDQFKSHLLREFAEKKFAPALIHDSLVRLDSRVVLTTNFDKLYENRASAIQHQTLMVKHYYDADLADILRRTQRCVLKIHGTIDYVDKTIFTRSDYARARVAHANFYRILEAMFLTHTFVFLGASMRDPDLRMLLEDMAFRYMGSRPHFLVTPRGENSPSVLKVMEESMNLRPLEYDPSHFHRELAEGVEDLRQQVDLEREQLTRTTNW